MIIFLASLTDLLLSPNKNQLSFDRTISQDLERGMTYTVSIEVRNDSRHSLLYSLKDGIPQTFESSFPLNGETRKNSTTFATYEIRPTERGKYEINRLYFRYTSILGLWQKQYTVLLEDSVKVIPDLTETKHYLENAQKFLLYEGMKIKRQLSGAGDFAQIRSYVAGDDPGKSIGAKQQNYKRS